MASQGYVIGRLIEERNRQDEIWKGGIRSRRTWELILSKQVGQLATALLDGEDVHADRQLTHIAAVAVAALEQLAEEPGRGTTIGYSSEMVSRPKDPVTWQEKRVKIIELCGMPDVEESQQIEGGVYLRPKLSRHDGMFVHDVGVHGVTVAVAYDRLWDTITRCIPDGQTLLVDARWRKNHGRHFVWSRGAWLQVEGG